ncbi:MAG: HD domain-containing protein [Gammaproteobacteria bacterium]|nr:MAG: HD domain-containing protein [Gammaproteobacteria bacterium]UTW43603.1 HD domain-containing protein [bacterium SCSIO 12844]
MNVNHVLFRYTETDLIISLMKILKAYDVDTALHSERVSMLAGKIAQQLNLSSFQTKGLKIGALLHDIGKLAIPLNTLNTPVKLSEETFNLVKNHPKIGSELLNHIHFPWPVTKMIEQHHEKIDGSGYPYGLKGSQICFEAKIIAVADLFDALYSKRAYKQSIELDLVIQIINESKGTKYDETVLLALENIIKKDIYQLSEVEYQSQYQIQHLKSYLSL